MIGVDGDGPGEGWELVGDTGTHPDASLNGHVAHAMGVKRTRPSGPVEFYLGGDPASPWVRDAQRLCPGLPHRITDPAAVSPFWIAIGVRDTGPLLVGRARAKVATLTRRPGEPHPGLQLRPVLVPIKLSAKGGRMFDRVDRS
ncbi:hypothetical protein [Solicola sp. PLA-1-18]|uniref:hypothetical protein n=1 Tax=Solicola sp. PLA-1-18 TaxID=3380532 RepID=UPI003B77B5A5